MRDSFHAAVKLFFYAFAVMMTMILAHPAYAAISMLCAMIRLSVLKKSVRSCLGVLPLWAIVAAANPLFNQMGDTVLFTAFGRAVTYEALLCGMTGASSFAGTVLWFMCFARELTADQLIPMLAGLTPTFGLLLTMTFRLIPDFFRRAERISGARVCIGRGIDGRASFKNKLEEGLTILSVMTGSTLENAMSEADSLRARGYGCGKRTSFGLQRFRGRDRRALYVLVILAAAALAGALNGAARAEFYPGIHLARPDNAIRLIGMLGYALFLLSPVIMQGMEAIVWNSLKYGR